MSNTIEQLIIQCRRDIQRKKARYYNALRVKHNLFGLEARAHLKEARHKNHA